MRNFRVWTMLFAILLAATSLVAQRRDPLDSGETDQLRESAQDPNKRIHLLSNFAKARMAAIDNLRSDQNMADTQADEVAKLLDDLASIVDEIVKGRQ